MRVSLATDNTLFLPIDAVVGLLNSICKQKSFVEGKSPIRIDELSVVCPASFVKLIPQLGDTSDIDLSVVFTSVPYENNYFYEHHQSLAIVSTSNWNLFTDQPIINGLFFCICTLLADELDLGDRHLNDRGCVNDMFVDKTGVDVAMRAGSLCPDCKALLRARDVDASDLLAMLDVVSLAARSGSTVLDCEVPTSDSGIDLFLCHNSNDKAEVQQFNQELKSNGLITWYDEDDLPPGSDWQEVIQGAIPRVRAAAVCVGASGLGPWQRMEIKGLLSEFVERGCRVVPVILPSAPSVPDLPLFLRHFTWLDLRTNAHKSMARLVGTLQGR